MTPPPVSVIVPCYNAEASCASLLERLDRMRVNGASSWHVIAVDDGSRDGTFAALLRAQRERPWLEVLHHQENLGTGAALRTGLAYSSSPVVCTIDSDCTYPPERLVELIGVLEQGAQLVAVSALGSASTPADGSHVPLLMSRIVSAIYQALVGHDLGNFTCRCCAYRREILEQLGFRSNGSAAGAEIMLRALASGADVREVPMHPAVRNDGDSTPKASDAIAAHLVLLTLATRLAVAKRARRTLGLRSH